MTPQELKEHVNQINSSAERVLKHLQKVFSINRPGTHDMTSWSQLCNEKKPAIAKSIHELHISVVCDLAEIVDDLGDEEEFDSDAYTSSINDCVAAFESCMESIKPIISGYKGGLLHEDYAGVDGGPQALNAGISEVEAHIKDYQALADAESDYINVTDMDGPP